MMVQAELGSYLKLPGLVQNNPPDIGVDLVFFDAEDHGDNNGQSDTWCLGSQYWARNLSAKNRPQYGILLDMVGSKGSNFSERRYFDQFCQWCSRKGVELSSVDGLWSLLYRYPSQPAG